VAAQDFIANLAKVFGENISRAIVEQHNDRYLEEYDMIRQTLGAGNRDFVYPALNAGVPGNFHPA